MSSRDTEGDVAGALVGGDIDIPPVTACATCGSVTCEGCTPQEPRRRPQSEKPSLPWETHESTALDRLLSTAELSATKPDLVFGTLARGSMRQALSFAVLCELMAVASFTLVWAIAFFLLFPFVARQMLTSPEVVLMIAAILLGLIAFVVAVHAVWGVGLEWGIARAGGTADMNRGIRFGLYACGWDLLTSPAGLYFEWRRCGFKKGFSHVRAGTKAPRASVSAYLDDCRGASARERKSAIWTAIGLGTVGVFMSGVLLFVGLLVAWMPWAFF